VDCGLIWPLKMELQFIQIKHLYHHCPYQGKNTDLKIQHFVGIEVFICVWIKLGIWRAFFRHYKGKEKANETSWFVYNYLALKSLFQNCIILNTSISNLIAQNCNATTANSVTLCQSPKFSPPIDGEDVIV